MSIARLGNPAQGGGVAGDERSEPPVFPRYLLRIPSGGWVGTAGGSGRGWPGTSAASPQFFCVAGWLGTSAASPQFCLATCCAFPRVAGWGRGWLRTRVARDERSEPPIFLCGWVAGDERSEPPVLPRYLLRIPSGGWVGTRVAPDEGGPGRAQRAPSVFPGYALCVSRYPSSDKNQASQSTFCSAGSGATIQTKKRNQRTQPFLAETV